MKTILLIIAFTIGSIFFGTSQTSKIKKIDRLISNLEEGIIKEGHSDLERYIEIDSLSERIQYDRGTIYGKIGKIIELSSNSPEASFKEIEHLKTLLKNRPSSFNDTNKVYFYVVSGRVHSNTGNYVAELEAYFKADQIAINSKDPGLQTFATNALCMYYARRKEYKKALFFNRKLISFYRKHKDAKNAQLKYRYLTVLRNAGIYQYGLHQYDSTIYYVNKAINNDYEKFGKMINAHVLLGNSYMKLGDLKMASTSKEYIITAMDSSYPIFNPEGFRANLFLGDFQLAQNNYETANKHYSLALSIADSTGQMMEQSEAYDKLVVSELARFGRNDLVQYFQYSQNISDTLFSHNSVKLEKQLRVQYDTAIKEKEIGELKFKDEVNRRTLTMIVLGSIIALVSAIFIGSRIHLRRKLLARKLQLSAVENDMLNFKLKNALDQINEKAELLHNLDKDAKINTQSLSHILDGNYLNESKWNEVIYYFDQLNDNFSTRIVKRFPQLTLGDIQLLILIKLNYSNKNIGFIRNVTEAGVKKAKSRLAKKLELTTFSEIYSVIFNMDISS